MQPLLLLLLMQMQCEAKHNHLYSSLLLLLMYIWRMQGHCRAELAAQYEGAPRGDRDGVPHVPTLPVPGHQLRQQAGGPHVHHRKRHALD